MNIILFIVILAILIFVHELGHFSVAKKFGIKVTEFGIGFPPKVASVKRGETEYTLNAIPFGGFVKIFGEDPDEESMNGPEAHRSLIAKPRLVQAGVLVAGVTFNAVFAWILLSIGFMVGMPTSVDYSGPGTVMDPHVIVTSVLPDSPASLANIKPGDKIISLESGKESSSSLTPESVSSFVGRHAASPILMTLHRGSTDVSVTLTPASTIANGPIIGVGMDEVGTLRLGLADSFIEGFKSTLHILGSIVAGLYDFFRNVFIGQPDLSDVTGPIGIIGLVGDVSQLGFLYVLSFTALISLNLAVINLLPFPALDGGRLVIIAIEGIMQKRLNVKVVNNLNAAGFVFLILLMILVTVHDILKIV